MVSKIRSGLSPNIKLDESRRNGLRAHEASHTVRDPTRGTDHPESI